MRPLAIATLMACALGATACGSSDPRLLYVQADKIGINTEAGTGAQGGTIDLGYRGFNATRVPVTTRDANGNVRQIRGTFQDGGGHYADAHSVFGRFQASAGGGQGIGLNKFFATGISARQLANGYQNKLRGRKSPENGGGSGTSGTGGGTSGAQNAALQRQNSQLRQEIAKLENIPKGAFSAFEINLSVSDVKKIQQALCVKQNGTFGPRTRASISYLERWATVSSQKDGYLQEAEGNYLLNSAGNCPAEWRNYYERHLFAAGAGLIDAFKKALNDTGLGARIPETGSFDDQTRRKIGEVQSQLTRTQTDEVTPELVAALKQRGLFDI